MRQTRWPGLAGKLQPVRIQVDVVSSAKHGTTHTMAIARRLRYRGPRQWPIGRARDLLASPAGGHWAPWWCCRSRPAWCTPARYHPRRRRTCPRCPRPPHRTRWQLGCVRSGSIEERCQTRCPNAKLAAQSHTTRARQQSSKQRILWDGSGGLKNDIVLTAPWGG